MKFGDATPRRLYRTFRRRHLVAASPRRVVIAMATIFALVGGLSMLRASQRHQVVRAGYQLGKVGDALRTEQELSRRLQLELATLTAPDRIRSLAMRMGMVAPSPERIRRIGESATAIGPASAVRVAAGGSRGPQ